MSVSDDVFWINFWRKVGADRRDSTLVKPAIQSFFSKWRTKLKFRRQEDDLGVWGPTFHEGVTTTTVKIFGMQITEAAQLPPRTETAEAFEDFLPKATTGESVKAMTTLNSRVWTPPLAVSAVHTPHLTNAITLPSVSPSQPSACLAILLATFLQAIIFTVDQITSAVSTILPCSLALLQGIDNKYFALAAGLVISFVVGLCLLCHHLRVKRLGQCSPATQLSVAQEDAQIGEHEEDTDSARVPSPEPQVNQVCMDTIATPFPDSKVEPFHVDVVPTASPHPNVDQVHVKGTPATSSRPQEEQADIKPESATSPLPESENVHAVGSSDLALDKVAAADALKTMSMAPTHVKMIELVNEHRRSNESDEVTMNRLITELRTYKAQSGIHILQNDNLKKENSGLQAKVDKLTSDKKDIQIKLNESTTAKKSLEVASGKLQTSNNTLADDVDKLEKKLLAKTNETVNSGKNAKILRDEIAALKAKAATDSEEANDVVAKALEASEETLKQLKEKSIQSKQDHGTELKKVTDDLEAAKQEAQKFERMLKESEAKVDRLKEELQAKTNTQTEDALKISKVSQDLKDSRDTAQRLEKELEANQGELREKTESSGQRSKQLETFQDTVQQLKKELETKAAQLTEESNGSRKLSELLHNAEKKVCDKDAEINVIKERVAAVENDIKKNAQTLAGKIEELQKATQVISVKDDEVKKVNDAKTALERQLTGLQDTKDTKQNEITVLTNAKSDLEQQLDSLRESKDGEIKALTDAETGLRSELEKEHAMNGKLEEKQKKINMHNETIQALGNEIWRKKQECKNLDAYDALEPTARRLSDFLVALVEVQRFIESARPQPRQKLANELAWVLLYAGIKAPGPVQPAAPFSVAEPRETIHMVEKPSAPPVVAPAVASVADQGPRSSTPLVDSSFAPLPAASSVPGFVAIDRPRGSNNGGLEHSSWAPPDPTVPSELEKKPQPINKIPRSRYRHNPLPNPPPWQSSYNGRGGHGNSNANGGPGSKNGIGGQSNGGSNRPPNQGRNLNKRH